MGKVVRIGRKGQLVLPKAVREALGLHEGDRLVVRVEQGRIVLSPSQAMVQEALGLLRGTWGSAEAIEAHLREEREAWDSQS